MKNLSVLILCFLSLNMMSQTVELNFHPTETKFRIPEPVKVISLYAGSIILEGIGDGLYDNGQKELGKCLQAVSLGMVLLSPAILNMDRDNWFWYVLTYTSFRIALFDYTYNITRDLPINHIGTTSYWDKALHEFSPPGAQLFFRGIFCTLAITIPINEL